MQGDLSSGLKSQIISCSWDDLSGFLTKTEMILVDSSLRLEEVGVAVAEDKVAEVQEWLDKGLLRKVDIADDQQIRQLSAIESFRLLVVSPFALVQPGV